MVDDVAQLLHDLAFGVHDELLRLEDLEVVLGKQVLWHLYLELLCQGLYLIVIKGYLVLGVVSTYAMISCLDHGNLTEGVDQFQKLVDGMVVVFGV